jgi:hypothetical protein
VSHEEILAATVEHYDSLRPHHEERTVRYVAVCYLRRKAPHLDATDAAVILADALARRAESE